MTESTTDQITTMESSGDTPHGLKPGGFLGQPAYWRAYPPTDLSGPVFDIQRGVVVAIKRTTARALYPAIR